MKRRGFTGLQNDAAIGSIVGAYAQLILPPSTWSSQKSCFDDPKRFWRLPKTDVAQA